jgi:hypothetical protein
MKQLTSEQLQEYLANPFAADPKVRKWCGLPEDRYYTVSVWPENLAGRVFVRRNEVRKITSKKISKSDQT